jgi:ribose transport system ATP-binding protein
VNEHREADLEVALRNIVEISNVSLRFGAILALDQVGLSLSPGEVRALVGANGSGKSTLVKVVAGYHLPDSGSVEVNGSTCDLSDARGVTDLWRVSAVHQDLGLIEGLTVTENFYLSELSASHSRRLNWSKMQSTVGEYLHRFGVDVSPRAKIAECHRVTRAMIALARAVWDLEGGAAAATDREDVGQIPSTLILDEITAFLSIQEVNLLKDVIKNVVSRGHSVLFVSHDLDEILSFADHITVLRDGRCVADRATIGVDKNELFELIAGKPTGTNVPSTTAMKVAKASEVIEVTGLTAGSGGVGPINFEVAPGEIIGLTGLVGSGYDMVPYALFGSDKSAKGSIRLPQGTFRLEKLVPADSMGLGIALIPGSRVLQGLWTDFSIGENLASVDGDLNRRPWALSWKKLWSHGDETIAKFAIKAPNARSRISMLSGGNAQRVLIAKWLATKPVLLLLHEPVQGVDVGSRSQIVDLILQRAQQGLAVICASGDHEILAQMASRVLVFHHGVVGQELLASDDTPFVAKDEIVWACQVKNESDFVRTGGED